MAAPAHRPTPDLHLRPGRLSDLDALVDLERRLFNYDQMSRRSFRRLLSSRTADLIVAEQNGAFAGYALVLFRPRSRIARLYSIAAVAAGHGIGPRLLAAAEDAARRRGCRVMRLEVHETNAAAIRRYEKSGYVARGRRLGYYTDGAHAQRFEKQLATPSPAS
jgi:[ribosomal protein S18]-alanine N-acetyltransferase